MFESFRRNRPPKEPKPAKVIEDGVLVVCRNNIARSQMAEAIYKHKTGRLDVASACTTPGEVTRVPRSIHLVMQEVGIELGRVKPNTFSRRHVEAAGRIIIMTDVNLPLYLSEPGVAEKIEVWDIPDPRGGTYSDLQVTRDALIECVEETFAADLKSQPIS